MKKLILALAFIFSPAAALASTNCPPTSTGLRLEICPLGTDGTSWAQAMKNNFNKISTGTILSSSSASGDIGILRVGQIQGLPAASGIWISSTTTQDSSFTLRGAGAHLLVGSSATASSFWGDGYNLTRINAANLEGAVPGANLNFSTITTALNLKLTSGAVPTDFINSSTITSRFSIYEPFLSTGTNLTTNGGHYITGDLTLGTGEIISNVSSLGLRVNGGASPLVTLDGSGNIDLKNAGSGAAIVFNGQTTLGAVSGDKTNIRAMDKGLQVLTKDGGTQLAIFHPTEGMGLNQSLTLRGSTATITGDAFSVGGSTLVVANGRVGIGTASPSQKLHMSSGTLLIDGNVANSIVASGNVGVGTASPGTKLHVSSGVILADGSGAGIQSTALAGTGNRCVHADANGVLGVVAGECGTGSGGGDVIASGDNAFTGDNTHAGTETFGSSVTFNGGVFGMVFASTAIQANADNTQVNQDTAKVCMSGSTMTVSVPYAGMSAEYKFAGNFYFYSTTWHDFVLLDNGAVAAGQSAGFGFCPDNYGGDSVHRAACSALVPNLTAGSHSFCVAPISGAGGVKQYSGYSQKVYYSTKVMP